MAYDLSAFGEAERGVLSLVSHELFSGEAVRIKNDNIAEVFREAYAQGVSSLAFSSVKIDDNVNDADAIRRIMQMRLMRNVNVNSYHARLNEIMTNADIPYVIIKGCASAFYYPDPLLRDMGDVDFLVNPSDFDRAKKTLVSLGFDVSHEEHGCHLVFEKDGCRYEMHREPSGIPDSEAGDILREYFDDITEKSVLADTQFGRIRIPSAFHHGLIILIHSVHHLTGEGLGLRHINDFVVFENSFDEDDFVSMFYEPLKKVGLWRFACVMTKLGSMFLGADERAFCDETDGKICENIMKDVFSSGNFGQKNADRSHEAWIMEKPGGEKKRSSLSRLFATANRIVREKWPISKKLVFLLPVGWLFFGGRYVIRSIVGKRPKINVMTVKKEADERKKLYDELSLYEIKMRETES